MNPLALIAAAKARREAAGLVSVDGIACPTQEFVDYYNARAVEPRTADNRVLMTPKLRALKAAAYRSIEATA
jgi:hypothetical protein